MDFFQRQRIGLLRDLMQMIDHAPRGCRGKAYDVASGRCGLSPKRLEKLYSIWRKEGDDALIEGRKLKKEKTSAADRLPIAPDDRKLLQNYVRRCDSMQYAIEAAAEDPRCSAPLRDYIRGYRMTRNYPKALLAAARASTLDRALMRGKKAFEAESYTQLRKNVILTDDGFINLEGGDLFECDDMSLNQPFWYEWEYGGDPLSDQHGVRIGRQMLAAVDVATGKWLGFDLIGRVRDAYRAEDVLRFLGRICDCYGIPRYGFRLERGVWMSNSIRGVREVTDDDEKITIGSVTDIVDIDYVWKSKAKAIIEGSFDFLQTILSLTGVTIGRKRGEYEETTRLMLQCATGLKHPKDIGLRHMNEAAEVVQDAMEKADNRPKMGRLLRGIPLEKFSAAVIARPLARVPEESAHLFLPVKQIRPIDGGFVRCKVPHYKTQFSFRVPPECAGLGNGYHLHVCFDPAMPDEGARVLDAESDRRRVFESVEGQLYGVWEYREDAPQLDRRTKKTREGYVEKKEYQAAARTAFRSTGTAVGTGASIDHMNDGNGKVATIASGIVPRTAAARADSRAVKAIQARHAHVAGGRAVADDKRRAQQLFKSSTPTPCKPQTA